MAPTRAQLLETAIALVEAFETWTIDALLAKRSTKSTQHFLPESLGRSAQDIDGFRRHIEFLMPLVPDGFKVNARYKEPMVDEAARKVAVFAKCSANTVAGPYHNEYIFIIHLNEDGTLADKVEEFLDSSLVRELESRLAAFEEQKP
ncbi:uncharacterized protein A1O9_07643 [Exophiala aquamarina CBS 119918]|uniref:SnoaL-like domain-containing protein n=1 Tax=Exophiala aquamarina CBS 119918 TaxID=1182545 RepID=A0A072P8I7_9EURO|nr:uncharacterized protein A1O9_07643 [Exophiala aquamarina CBS 119918]KEF56062.1 hypothetical protein A1O9_07643 [Exophiala aquamarina CBS 119918]